MGDDFLSHMSTDAEPGDKEKILKSFIRRNRKLRYVHERLKTFKAHMDRDHLERELRYRTKHLRRLWKQNQQLKRRIRELEEANE